MSVCESWVERFPFLEPLADLWEPVPRPILLLASGFYAFFLWQLMRGSGLPHYMDLVFIPIHEGGHLLFRFFGQLLAVAGGTLLQLGIPLLLAFYFGFRRQIQGVAFCLFFFFEQFLPTGAYMADARAQELPLLTVGDTDDVIHDWNYLFSKFGLLDHDTQIASMIRVVGWAGMLLTVVWMVWRSLRSQQKA